MFKAYRDSGLHQPYHRLLCSGGTEEGGIGKRVDLASCQWIQGRNQETSRSIYWKSWHGFYLPNEMI